MTTSNEELERVAKALAGTFYDSDACKFFNRRSREAYVENSWRSFQKDAAGALQASDAAVVIERLCELIEWYGFDDGDATEALKAAQPWRTSK